MATVTMSTRKESADGFVVRRENTRQLIVDAAVRLVAERGFSATSVDDIAAAAGVAKGSVYYNFGSKTDVLEAALELGLERVQTMLDEVRVGLTGRAALHALISGLLNQVHARPDFAKLIAAEVFRVGREWQESIGLIRSTIIASYERALEEMRPGEDVSILAASVFGAVLVAGLEWLVFQPEREFDDVLDGVLQLTAGL